MMLNRRQTLCAALSCLPFSLQAQVSHTNYSSEQKEWCLATAALLTVANRRPHNDLNEGLSGPLKIADGQKLLMMSRIRDQLDLFKAIRLMKEKGHRTMFSDIARRVRGLGEDGVSGIVAFDKYPDLMAHRIRVIQKFENTLDASGIFCFDYCRMVSWLKWAHMAEMISEQQAWDTILPIAIQIQATVKSWDQMAHQYRVGRLFLEIDPKGEIELAFDRAQQQLLGSPLSPWRRLPWALSLPQV